MTTILELEQQDIELQLQEIQLKRKLNQMEREKITNNKLKKALIESPSKAINIEKPITVAPSLHLHYCKSAVEAIPRIADVCPDGSIKIYGKNNAEILTKKYSMKSLLWIKKNLEKWSNQQRKTTGFFRLLSEKYSKRFVKISKTTMESLCYFVDSGAADKWFNNYEMMKSKQVTLEGGVL